jgi:hypothetical protein
VLVSAGHGAWGPKLVDTGLKSISHISKPRLQKQRLISFHLSNLLGNLERLCDNHRENPPGNAPVRKSRGPAVALAGEHTRPRIRSQGFSDFNSEHGTSNATKHLEPAKTVQVPVGLANMTSSDFPAWIEPAPKGSPQPNCLYPGRSKTVCAGQ